MTKHNPKKNMEMLEQTLAAWREHAPDVKFGGISLAEFQALVERSRDDRGNITDNENEGKGLIIKRDNNDLDALAKRELVVNGIIGDHNFGPNSAFYESNGYVRKADRKSGLTRKKKNEDNKPK